MACAAVIVTFNPDIELLEKNILAIKNQVHGVFLVDNHSDNYTDILNLIHKYQLDSHAFEKNEGIAVALNAGLEYAQKNQCDWLITLDQDTVVTPDMVSLYMHAQKDFQQIGIICGQIDYQNGVDVFPNSTVHTVDSCITSASCVNVEIAYRCGCFDEKMFIDYVDFEFCYRIRSEGYHILQVDQVVIKHELGDVEIKRAFPFFKKTVKVYNYSPFRVYMYVRNSLYTMRKHAKTIHLGKELKVVIRWVLIIVIYQKKHWASLKAVFKGIVDGLRMEVRTCR